jgi:hypothetical protein
LTAPNAQELAQLRDIHLPGAIGWWPLAPGWYVLATLSMVALITIIFFIHRYHSNSRARRQALRLLTVFQQQYQRDANGSLAAARVSELLKRVSLAYFPRASVASLQGESWLGFLNSTATGLDFNGVRTELLDMPYQSTRDCDLHQLFIIARAWIKQRRGPCLN